LNSNIIHLIKLIFTCLRIFYIFLINSYMRLI